MKRCNLDKTHTCKIYHTKNKTCCKNANQDWCWNKNNKKNCSVIKQKMKCRIVKGKKETCCINPMKGHWCWSNRTKKNVTIKMKKQCCNARK